MESLVGKASIHKCRPCRHAKEQKRGRERERHGDTETQRHRGDRDRNRICTTLFEYLPNTCYCEVLQEMPMPGYSLVTQFL